MGEDQAHAALEARRDLEIPREQAVEQKPVPFLGDELAAAITAGGAIYVSLPGMCRALGLGTQAQLQRILRTSSLARGVRMIPLATRGGEQLVNCLRVDKVALWLAGIETGRVKPPSRAKIEAYQDELAPVATQVFLRMAGIAPTQLVPASADPQIQALAEQIETLTDVVTFLREHLEAMLASVNQVAGITLRLDQAIALVEALAVRQDTTETLATKTDERTQHLTPAHARTVQELVDRMVRETQRLPMPLTHAIVYGRLKDRFRAGSYKAIPDKRYDEVLAYLREELRRATSGEAPEQGSMV